jgi:folate-dependent phosphoribosylglycinamide formyltransferase PurN
MNQRLMLQQGLFVLPLSLQVALEAQLAEVLSPYKPDKTLFRAYMSKNIPRRDILKKLHAMNIHPASLFPGLDGYARSLRMRYEINRLGTPL